jgi:hypothetical protein
MNSPAVVGCLERGVRPAFERSCKTCRFLAVHPDARGRIVVRAKNAYECRAIVPMPPLPDSVTRSHGFRWPIDRRYMGGDDGTLCPTWEVRA